MKKLDTFFTETKSTVNSKMSFVFILYAVLSVVSLLLSNIVVVKNFSFFDLNIGGYDITLTSSVIVFPIIYICSDIFSEVYGYKWSRIISWIAFVMNVLMVGIFELTIRLPGNDAEVAGAFERILGSSFGILGASLTAYMVGDLFNDIVFEQLRKRDTKKTNARFVFRSLLSSLCGEIVDTGVFLPCLFLLTGQFGSTIKGFSQIVAIIIIQACLKVCVEIILFPLTILAVKSTRRYEARLAAAQ